MKKRFVNKFPFARLGVMMIYNWHAETMHKIAEKITKQDSADETKHLLRVCLN